ncbi:hypothetical protein [Pseudomonas fulva]|uniref:hypothetical protein n=1 Tax=Pseudomonas fulva TaxID=47880 RepID=UPI001788B149|nr:hypothetical protein [Pseudomonas fulva]
MPAVAQHRLVYGALQRKEVIKRGNIGRGATEVLLMEALHITAQRLLHRTFDVFRPRVHSTLRQVEAFRWGILPPRIPAVAAEYDFLKAKLICGELVRSIDGLAWLRLFPTTL